MDVKIFTKLTTIVINVINVIYVRRRALLSKISPCELKYKLMSGNLPRDIIRITGQVDQNDVLVQEVVTHKNSSNTSPGINNGYGVALSKEKV